MGQKGWPKGKSRKKKEEKSNMVEEIKNGNETIKNETPDEPDKESSTQSTAKEETKSKQTKKKKRVIVNIRGLYNHKACKDYPMGEQDADEILIELAQKQLKSDNNVTMVTFA